MTTSANGSPYRIATASTWLTKGVATISRIFDWYKTDFDRLGGVGAVLAKYSPAYAASMKTAYKAYRWGLNDSSDLGANYPEWKFYRDRLMN